MGKITTWHDRRIVPGQEFEHQIDHYFSQADIILLLISSDFIASDYCYQVEMTNALERHKKGEAVVIPVILRECAWHQLPFGSIMAATIDGSAASHHSAFMWILNGVFYIQKYEKITKVRVYLLSPRLPNHRQLIPSQNILYISTSVRTPGKMK